MSSPHRIELGGTVIDGTHGAVTFAEIAGWYGVPDVRGNVEPVPNAHGSFVRHTVWRESRAVSIRGSLRMESRSESEAQRDSLTSAWLAASSLTVEDETGTWSTAVEVDRVDFQDRGAWSSQIPFTIDLIAADPVRYSELLTSGPALLPTHDGGLVLPSVFPWDFGTSTRHVASVENTGEVPILPVVRVTGSADSITVRGGPRRVSYGAFSGELVLDSLQRRAWLNGVDVTRDLVRRDWPVVPAGVTHVFDFVAVNPSDVALLVEYRIGVW